MFIKVRMTWFPVDSIDQIDEINGRLRICLSSGVRIDLDPIESEKVEEQLRASTFRKEYFKPKDENVMAEVKAVAVRINGLEGSIDAVDEKVEFLRRALGVDAPRTKARVGDA